MATAFIQPPSHFEPGNKPAQAWEEWRSAYELYEEACEYNTKNDGPRRALLLHALGPAARKTYKGFVFAPTTSTRQCETPLEILDKFEELYRPYKNITHSSAIFNSIIQKPNQTIDELVAELKSIAIDCDYGDKCDRLIGDRLIFGIRDAALRERLLRETSLTLDKIINLCKTAEISKDQAKTLQLQTAFSTTEASVSVLNQRKQRPNFYKQNQSYAKAQPVKFQPRQTYPQACSRCGTQHPPRKCPAYGINCHKCGTFGHFSRVCKKKRENSFRKNHQVAELTDAINNTNSSTSVASEDFLFIGELSIDSLKDKSKWTQKVLVNNAEIIFKIDTGSDVNILPASIFKHWSIKPLVKPTTSTIITYSGQKLSVTGVCRLHCQTTTARGDYTFFIIEGDLKPILGADTSEDLALLTRCQSTSLVSSVDHGLITENVQDIIESFSDVFTGLGKLPGKYHITTTQEAVPRISAPRSIPLSLQQKVKSELKRMETLGIITKVNEPTDWVHPLAIVVKKNGGIRLCLDPRHLNEAISREHYKIPTQEELFSTLDGCKLFSLFDASDAFWQLQLDSDSSKLCTFATPWGRFRFLRMPFGLNCAPELFQRAMDDIFRGEPNFHLYFDDILISAKTDAEHCILIRKLLVLARENGLKLNKNKMKLGLNKISFLGHTLSDKGISPDPTKVKAILCLSPPSNTIELMRFLGMITYLTRFIPQFSQHTIQMRSLLKSKTPWVWDENVDKEFQEIKTLISSAPILAYFNPRVPIVISTDASSYGLGCVLLQDERPVAYASASLTPTQQQWAQIEKELLAVVFACEKFNFFIYGTEVVVHTDHKPLLGLLNKPLEKITPRLQRLVLRLQRYNVILKFVPGKFLNVADTLSRAPDVELTTNTFDINEEITVCSLAVLTTPKLNQLREQTLNDATLQEVMGHIKKGWPNSKQITNQPVRAFSFFADELHIADGLVCRGQRIVIPKAAQSEILNTLHIAHRGIVATKNKARQSVYWPTMCSDIVNMVSSCCICQQNQRNNQREPLEDRALATRPWQSVAVDFFHLNDKTYLLVIDYFSKYIEVQPMKTTTACGVILALKSIFARFGLPDELVSDNGPPFDSIEFKTFLQQWDINHNPSAPFNPRSNGQAERAVQTLKSSLNKAFRDGRDLYTVLMDYRNTPANSLKSPAELLMGRRIRTLIPTLPTNLKPQYRISDTLNQLKRLQLKQHQHGDKHTKVLKPLLKDDKVWFAVKKGWQPGVVSQVGPQKRSYMIKGPGGSKYRRNRFHIKPRIDSDGQRNLPELQPDSLTPMDYFQLDEPPIVVPIQPVILNPPSGNNIHSTTRCGRTITRPLRYLD